MRIFYFTFIVFLDLGWGCYGQIDNVWTFGDRAGIDFNYNPPQAIRTSMMAGEGSASVCDSNGRLLFYTQGQSVWNRNHQLMPNANNLVEPPLYTASSSQASVIVPVPGMEQVQYYIFSLSHQGLDSSSGHLFYSIVDMRLNNGLGDVISKGNKMDSCLTELMTAVSGNDCDVWLLVVSRLDCSLKAFRIDGNGVASRPVVSALYSGRYPSRYLRQGVDLCSGYMALSSDRRRLGIALGDVALGIYDFNPAEGSVSNPLILKEDTRFYGTCFSPNNSKFYASSMSGVAPLPQEVFQFDLSTGDSLQIVDSRVQISGVSDSFSNGTVAAMKMSRDGRIYVIYNKSGGSTRTLGVIQDPDSPGLACMFEPDAFNLDPQTRTMLGLPNSPVFADHMEDARSVRDTAFCTDRFLLRAVDTTGRDYIWNDSSHGSQREVRGSGVYWVSYIQQKPCMTVEWTDTFYIYFDSSRRYVYTTSLDTGMCSADTVYLVATNREGSGYRWEDGSSGPERSVYRRGVYWLRYEVDAACSDYVDTFRIYFPEPEYRVSFAADSLACTEDVISFQNTSDAAYQDYIWFLGDGTQSDSLHVHHRHATPGLYHIMLTGKINDHCRDTFSRTITVDTLQPAYFTMDRDEICRGESIYFRPVMDWETVTGLYWQMGQDNDFSNPETFFVHAFESEGIKPVTLYARFRACPEAVYSDTVLVHDLPVVDLGPDSILCFHRAPITLTNRVASSATSYYRYQWSTGDTTASITVRKPGIYSLQVSSGPLGCSSTEEVKVSKDCYIDIPNAFTPDGDGYNDYFFPRQLLSRNVVAFKMQVFNRWGQLMFETTNINGRGWDGKYDNRNQPAGVYIYHIELLLKENHAEQYQGNVTLIR